MRDMITGPICAAAQHVARAQLRIPSVYRARLRREGQPDLPIRIGNISRSGFMAETKGQLRAGMSVRLVPPFGKVRSGTVRWSLNGRFGCRLDEPFGGGQMLAITLLAGARVSSILLVALLVVAAAL